MEQRFEIAGMHCNGCVARVTRALAPLADQLVVTLDPPLATLTVATPLTLDEVQAAVARVGEFRASRSD